MVCSVVQRPRRHSPTLPPCPPLISPTPALAFYGLNASLSSFTWLFFRFNQRKAALASIVASLGLSIASTALFWRRSSTAGALMLPLNFWLVYAGSLNLYDVLYNKEQSK